MTRKLGRNGLIILAVIGLIALAGFAAACGNNNATTTSISGSTTTGSSGSTGSTSAGSTGSTSAGSTQTSTMIVGGKTPDEYKAEIPNLEKAVAANPADLTSLQELAIAYYVLGNYDQAAAAYVKILAQKNDALTINNLANVYREAGKTDQAIAEYQKAISLDPKLRVPYVNLAGVYVTKGDIPSALKVLEQAKAALSGADKTSVEQFENSLTSTTT
jgi:tetratricopeptide (TPR) repeat protein